MVSIARELSGVQGLNSIVLMVNLHSDGDGEHGQAYGVYCIYLEYAMKTTAFIFVFENLISAVFGPVVHQKPLL